MRVALVTTGRMELLALPGSLARLFPDHVFYAESFRTTHTGRREPFPGYTSARARPLPEGDVPTNLDRLVRAAVATLIPEEPGASPADFAFILEDLELVNKGNEQTLCDVVRRVARHHSERLDKTSPELARSTARLLRDRVSYHLAVPMPEAWFFGAPSVLRKAGIPPKRLVGAAIPSGDCERFHVDDPAYLTDNGSACTQWISKGRPLPPRSRRGRYPPWLTATSREQHPKAYLAWLARNPSRPNCTSYRETQQGRRALSRLDWYELLQNPSHATYARSMLSDLADALGISPPGLRLDGAEAPLTSIRARPSAHVLRNL